MTSVSSASSQRSIARLPQGPEVLLGPGDDAAVLAVPDGRVVATTDVLVEGRHFRRDWSDAVDIGHKAVAQSLADIAAMGARATGLLVGLGVPADLPVQWTTDLADGMREECALVGASVIGGDVVRSDKVVIVGHRARRSRGPSARDAIRRASRVTSWRSRDGSAGPPAGSRCSSVASGCRGSW